MPRRNASRKKRILSTNSGASLFRLDSKIIPAAENSLSTSDPMSHLQGQVPPLERGQAPGHLCQQTPPPLAS